VVTPERGITLQQSQSNRSPPHPGRGTATPLHDEAEGGQYSRPPAFPSGAGRPSCGLVSTTDGYLAFGQMLLNNGTHGSERVLSSPSVEIMTTDHLTPEQKAISGFFPGYLDNRG
jgi:CubicO group peptidase (beta-lactamase class C family)